MRSQGTERNGRWKPHVCAAALCTLVATTIPASALTYSDMVQLVGARARPPLPSMGPSFRSQVAFVTGEPAGTVVVRKGEKALYLVDGKGKALRYRISVGREGFAWLGVVRIGAKKEWPEWRPPADMRKRQPDLPAMVPAGPYNPLGARAIYLHDATGRDTLYRIHGTNDPKGVGFDGTSGCFRLTNTDVVDLFKRVSVGAKVVVIE